MAAKLEERKDSYDDELNEMKSQIESCEEKMSELQQSMRDCENRLMLQSDINNMKIRDMEEKSDFNNMKIKDIEEISDINNMKIKDMEETSDINNMKIRDMEEKSHFNNMKIRDMGENIEDLKSKERETSEKLDKMEHINEVQDQQHNDLKNEVNNLIRRNSTPMLPYTPAVVIPPSYYRGPAPHPQAYWNAQARPFVPMPGSFRHPLPIQHVTTQINQIQVSASNTEHQSRSLVGDRHNCGEIMYSMIREMYPDQAGKITGMLLEMETNEVLNMLKNKEVLKEKIESAAEVLKIFKNHQLL